MSVIRITDVYSCGPSSWLLNGKKLSLVAHRALDTITYELTMSTERRLDNLRYIFFVNFS